MKLLSTSIYLGRYIELKKSKFIFIGLLLNVDKIETFGSSGNA